MYQHELDPKQDEKKSVAIRRASTGSLAADMEMSPHPGLPTPGQFLLSLQSRRGNQHVQRVVDAARQDTPALPIQAKKDEPRPNRTGLPDELKAGVENLSGLSLDDVRVHYNSSKPALLEALAYAQGTEIHLAPGQERHLPHEAWHIVQQAQRRVRATGSIRDILINDDQDLELEARQMGMKVSDANVTLTKIQQTRMAPEHKSHLSLYADRTSLPKQLCKHNLFCWESDPCPIHGQGYEPLSEVSPDSIFNVELGARKAQHSADTVSSTRTKEAMAAAKNIGQSAALMALDAVAPGVGTLFGRIQSVSGIQQASRYSGGVAAAASAVGTEVLGAIWPPLSFSFDVYNFLKSLLENPKDRTGDKVKLANQTLREIRRNIKEAEKMLADLNRIGAPDREAKENIDRLKNDFKVLGDAESAIEAWIGKKEQHGSMPLLAELE